MGFLPSVAARLQRHWGVAAVVAGFVVSRLYLAIASHIQFDNRPLNTALQLLDRKQLREDLVGSLFHLHAQPPLFNLFVGLGLQAPTRLETPLFHAVYLAFGLALALCLYAVLRRVGASTAVAAIVALLFTWSPSVFLYESWLAYDYPLVLLLCLVVLALQRYEAGRRPREAALFLTLVGAVVLTRSVFHLLWLLLWVVVLVVDLRGDDKRRTRLDRRRLLAAAALPVLVVAGLHVQRYVAFGTPSLSSAIGISLAKITTFQLPEVERRELVAEGTLSPLALVEPLSPAADYRGIVPSPARSGVPVLDDDQKGIYESPPTDSEFFRTNMNSLVFLEVSEGYLSDAVTTVRIRPRAYLQGVMTATEIFFRPTSDFFTLAENRQRVGRVDRLYNRVAFGVVAGGQGATDLPEARFQYRLGPARTAWVVVAAYVVALIGGAVLLVDRLRARRRGDQATILVPAFLWITTVYIAVVTNLLEVGENNRFRLYSDPLVLVLLVLLVIEVRRRRARPGTVASDDLPGADADCSRLASSDGDSPAGKPVERTTRRGPE
ncbi:MAG: hypothetical protein ACR2G7_11520 [Acidimicrobiales bacterium]